MDSVTRSPRRWTVPPGSRRATPVLWRLSVGAALVLAFVLGLGPLGGPLSDVGPAPASAQATEVPSGTAGALPLAAEVPVAEALAGQAPATEPADAPAAEPVALSADAPAAEADRAEPVTLIFYWGDGCPRCAAQKELLDRLEAENRDLTIERYEIWFDEENREQFRAEASQLGIDGTAVPATILDERVWVGYTDAIGEDIERTVEAALAGEPVPSGQYGRPGEGTCSSGTSCEVEGGATIDVPLLGELDISNSSLVLSTLAIGFVDGINPCSLWVISILLAIVIRTGSRGRVLAIGTTFLLVTAGMYALFMVGIYSALTVIGYLGAVQVVIGLAAGTFGAINVKDYFAFKRGVSLSIPEGSKPGIYQRMRRVTAQRALVPALAGTAALAVGVSILETPCTAGFPVLWTGLLAANDVSFAQSAGLFGLYMVPFLLDEFVVFLVAVATMRASRLQEQHGRLLKLVAGVVMLALAAVMLLAPEIMENVLGAMLVFLGAGLVAGVIHGATLLLRRLDARVAAAAEATKDAEDAEETRGSDGDRGDGQPHDAASEPGGDTSTAAEAVLTPNGGSTSERGSAGDGDEERAAHSRV